MPRKREDIPEFDAAKSLDAKYEKLERERQELRQVREMKAREEAEVNLAWQEAITRFDLPSFQNLGHVLVRWNQKIWADFLGVTFPRVLHLAAIEGDEPEGLLDANTTKILAIRLLVASCGDSELDLGRELDRISKMEYPLHVRGNVGNRLWEYSTDIESWHRDPHQPTPWITKAELIRSVQGQGEGFNKKGIDRQIEIGKLIIVHEQRLNKKSKLCRYRHEDPAIHDVMLRSVIDFLKNWKKVSSSKPWYEPLWKPL